MNSLRDQAKTKAELLSELAELRQEVAKLKANLDAKSYENSRGALAETRMLYDISARLNTSQSQEEVLEAAILPGITAGASSAGIWLFDVSPTGQPEWMEFTATWVREGEPLLPLGTRLRLVDFPSHKILLNEPGQPSFISDIENDERVDPRLRAIFSQVGVRAVAFVPLTIRDRWIGVTIISWQTPHTFSASEQQLYQSIAAQTAVAIENRRLYAQAQAALTEVRQSQEDLLKFKLGIEQSSEAVFLTNTDGVILYINPAFEKIYGFTREEVIGHTPRILKSGLIPQEGYERFWKTLLAKGNVTGEIVNKAKDGRFIHIAANNNPILDEQENIIGFLAVHHDITERKQAEEILARRVTEFQTVSQVSTAVSTIVDTDQLLQLVVDLTKSSFNLYHAHIYLYDGVEGMLNLAAGAGEVGQQMVAQGWSIPFDKERSLVAQAARTGEGVIANDVRQNPDFLPNPLLPETRSEMAIPIMIGGLVLGVLDVQSDQLNHFTADDVRIQTVLAEQIAVALENANQYAQTQKALAQVQESEEKLSKRAVELETVAQVGTATSTILDTQQLLQQVVDLTKSRFELYHAHIYLLNEAGDTLQLAAGAGEVGRQMVAQGWSIPLEWEQSLVAQAARSRQGMIVNDVQAALGFMPNPLLPETRAELAVPLIVGEQVLGVLDVQSDQLNHFSEEDIHIQSTLAAQVAVALQNARSFAEQERANLMIKKRVRELNCLNEIGREIAETPLIPEFLQWVTERIPLAMQYPRMCMAAIEYDGQTYGDLQAVTSPYQIVHALRVSGQVVGRVYIAYSRKYDFLDEESALIGGIANRVSGYIESHRLFEQTLDALAQIENSQHFLRTLLDNIPNPVFYKDTEGAYLGFNRAFLEYIGKTEEELLGKTVYDLNTDKALADRYSEADLSLFRNPGVQIYEAAVKYADGSIRDVIFNKATFTNPDGTLGGLVGAMVDITERKRAEEALRQSEVRYRTMTENLPIGVYRNAPGPQGKFLMINEAMAHMFGYSSVEELMQYRPVDLYYDAAERKAFSDKMLAQGRVINEEMEFKRKDGTRLLVAMTATAVRDEAGQVAYFDGIIEDITERKLAEDALRENEARLAEALAIARLAYWEFDVVTQTFTWNDQSYALLHTTAEQEGGYQMPAMVYGQKFIHPDDTYILNPEHQQQVLETAGPSPSRQLEHRVIRADGSEGYFLVKFREIKDDQGRTIRTVGINQDITEQKQAEAERERLLAEVQGAYRQYIQREWEEFLGGQQQGSLHVEHQQKAAPTIFNDELAKAQAEVAHEGKAKVIAPPNGAPTQPVIVAPIALRGQVIGTLSLQDIDPDRYWTDEEKALVETVSEQLALTVENLRLFDDTQKRAVREQMTRQIADKMRAAPDIDSIVQTGLNELAKALNVSRAYVKLTTKPEDKDR